jgi:hypothetical protein
MAIIPHHHHVHTTHTDTSHTGGHHHSGGHENTHVDAGASALPAGLDLHFSGRGHEWVQGSSGYYYEYVDGVYTGNWRAP